MGNPVIKDIAAPAGGVIKLSLALGLSRAAVAQWKRVPAERVIAVERLTGVSRQRLRPDLYPDQDGERLASAEGADGVQVESVGA